MSTIRQRLLCSSAHLLIGFTAFSLFGAVLDPTRVAAEPESLLITTSFADKVVNPDERIELLLNRRLNESEERLAVLIGTIDVTSLFTSDKLRLRYNGKLWPLPLGESQVTVYLVTKDDDWKEIARVVMRVSNEKTKKKADDLDESSETPGEPSNENELKATFLK